MADFDEHELRDRIERYRRRLRRYRNDAMARRTIERAIEQFEAQLGKHEPKKTKPAKR